MVVDMRGGDVMPGDTKTKVTSVGEFVLIDEQGNFTIRNELDDHDRYQRYTLADEIKPATNTGGYGGGYPGSGGGYPGSEGGGGYPGMGGGE